MEMENTLESSIKIANYFVLKSINTGKELSPIKVLKLVYLSHGWYLGLNGKPLISEAVQAWQYGPVVQEVYYSFKNYGSDQITSFARLSLSTVPLPNEKEEKDKELIQFLDKIWEIYGDWTGLVLSTLTHEPNSPWDTVWNKQGGKHRKGAIIPNDLIRDYYKAKSAE